nr:ATP synthase F0 subunit 8 [Rhizosolenia setigera]
MSVTKFRKKKINKHLENVTVVNSFFNDSLKNDSSQYKNII